MARTYTATAAQTFTRLELLKTQVRVALLRAANISPSGLDKVMKGMDNRWIERINVWALDNTELCRAELSMRIDWQDHAGKLAIGKTTVVIDERWSNDTAVETQETIRLFETFVRANDLKKHWTVGYGSSVDGAKVNKILGFEDADPIRWAGKSELLEFQVPELSEFRVGCRVVTD